MVLGIIAAVSVLTLVLVGYLILQFQKSGPGEDLQKLLLEMTAGITKTTSDTRNEISEKLNEKFTFIGKELREELSRSTKELEIKFTALENKVGDRLDVISKEVQIRLDKNIQEGFSHFQKVQEMLGNAEKQLAGLNAIGQSVQDLNSVLNLPHLRGKILGEGSLERLLADYLPAEFYESQFQIENSLVDFVVKFPHLSLVLPIDSKFSMEQVSSLYEPNCSPEELKTARKKLADVVKQNARDIKSKYIKPKFGTTDYALMYLPSETLYFEVIRDTELWGIMADLKVFPVSPNTFAITINSIGKALQYYEMGKGVQKTIQQIQKAKDHMDNFKNRFDDIGEKLMKAQESFQKATTHFSHYSSSVERLSTEETLIPLPSVEQKTLL